MSRITRFRRSLLVTVASRKFFGLATASFGLLAFVAMGTAAPVGTGEAGPSPSGLIQTLQVVDYGRANAPAIITITSTLKKQDGSKPVFITEADFHFPKGMRLGYKDFPKCKPSALENTTGWFGSAGAAHACSKKARLGGGLLTADFGAGDEKVGLAGLNGSPAGTYILVVDSPGVQPNLVLVGRFSNSPSGPVLKIPIPRKAPFCPINPDQCVPITHFYVSIGTSIKKKGTKKKIAYLTNPKRCPPSPGYRWSMEFTYINGEKLSPTAGRCASGGGEGGGK
jgi:hypothetical protein